MKKCLLLIISIFLLTGCDVVYNLEINDGFSDESVKFILEDDGTENDSMDMYIEPYENYSNLLLPLSKNDGVLTYDGRQDNIKYYKFERLDDEFGLRATGHFNKTSIENSSIISSIQKDNCIVLDDASIKIKVPKKMHVFEAYSILDNLEVNITVNDYNVISNNADEVNGNTYSWFISRDDYNDKTIELKLDKPMSRKIASGVLGNISTGIVNFINGLTNKEMIVICIGIVVLSVLIYAYIKKKKDDINKF